MMRLALLNFELVKITHFLNNRRPGTNVSPARLASRRGGEVSSRPGSGQTAQGLPRALQGAGMKSRIKGSLRRVMPAPDPHFHTTQTTIHVPTQISREASDSHRKLS